MPHDDDTRKADAAEGLLKNDTAGLPYHSPGENIYLVSLRLAGSVSAKTVSVVDDAVYKITKKTPVRVDGFPATANLTNVGVVTVLYRHDDPMDASLIRSELTTRFDMERIHDITVTHLAPP